MQQTQRIRSAMFGVATALVLLPGMSLAQADMAPVNDLPNPYRTIEGWAKMPAGRTWGATSAVGIDPDGESVWVAERCGANSCRLPNSNELSPLQIIMKFDRNGNMVT